MKKIYTLSLLLALGLSANAQVVISQVFSAGGNTGASIKDDYIELYNLSTTSTINLNGWFVQYASSTGPSVTNNPTQKWTGVALPNYNVLPNKYCLIKLSTGTNGVVLTSPDIDLSTIANTAVPTAGTGIGMGGSSGKIAIINDSNELTGINPSTSNIVDLVGYGTGTNGFEGAGAAPIPTSVNSIFRVDASGNITNGSMVDTNNNNVDFKVATANPRNSTLSNKLFDAISGLKVYPNPAKNNLFISSDNNEIKQVEIYNVLGKVVLNTKVTNSPVNVSAISAGVYVVKITEAGKTATRKLVIE